MYKIEYYKDDYEGWRKVESKIAMNENILRANLYNLQKRGYFIMMVTFIPENERKENNIKSI